MRWRHPDRPLHIYSLMMVVEDEWMSQPKYDGHFAVIIKEGSDVVVMSRHNKPLPVSPHVVEGLKHIDPGTVLWGEWTSRREFNKEEAIYLFSMAYQNHQWLGGLTELDRYTRLSTLKFNDPIHIVENRLSGHIEQYKETINNWKLEGIVLKRKNSRLIGDISNPKDNPGFLKLKWRDGAKGDSVCVVPDSNLVYCK